MEAGRSVGEGGGLGEAMGVEKSGQSTWKDSGSHPETNLLLQGLEESLRFSVLFFSLVKPDPL